VAIVLRVITVVGWAATLAAAVGAQTSGEYLSWSKPQAERILRSMRTNGQVGGSFDLRITHTEHSYNYKLRATWFTPDVTRAAARLVQLAERLTDEQTQALVDEVDRIQGTVVMVEVDPREGPGVIPLDWLAILQPRDTKATGVGVKGESRLELRNMRALASAFRRDYDYEVFWMVFPTTRADGTALFSASDSEAELLVRIHDKEGRVRWPIPESMRRRPR